MWNNLYQRKKIYIENKLKELNIHIPDAPDPVGAYVAFKKIDSLLYISGQLPIASDGKIIKGKIEKASLTVLSNTEYWINYWNEKANNDKQDILCQVILANPTHTIK